MLDFFSYCDAHIHLHNLNAFDKNLKDSLENINNYKCCSSCININELEFLDKINNGKNKIFSSFGIYPQNPVFDNDFIDKFEDLLKNKKINAIGECGFDLYTDFFKQNIDNQIKAWNIQLELAVKYNKTLVVHCRKALDYIFSYTNELKKLPCVIFHSFCGNYIQAISLLKKGINCYFSFGKQILNNNKKSIECVCKLDINNLLLETDAPYQTLKNEFYTDFFDISKVYEKAYLLRGKNINNKDEQIEFSKLIENNFIFAFDN